MIHGLMLYQKSSPLPPFWLMGVVTLVLLGVVVAITLLSTGQREAVMVRLLLGEGGALIGAVEGNVRMSIRTRATLQLQESLQAMVSSDVLFVAIAMPDGTFLAHSMPEKLGDVLEIDGQEMNERQLHEQAQTSEDGSLRWFVADIDGKQTFVVFRHFMPHPPRKQPFFRILPPRPTQPLVFLGLNMTPFELSRRQDKLHLFSLAGGTIVISLALLMVVYYAQHARESRQRQYVAEGQVRMLEEEVRRKEKMAAIGNLAAGVAHEIRNPLSSIKGYATYFGQRFPEGSDDRNAAHVMVNEVERLNRVITDLIGLSRPTDVRMMPVQLADVIQHAVYLLQPDAQKKHVTIHWHPPTTPLPQVYIDTDRFQQAFLNVCLNALDAFSGAETPHILHITLEKANNHQVCLSIRDTGTGIAAQHLPHIFDPYFSTKGHGTGLGLAIVHKIIEAHGGEIDVTSHTDGTTTKNIVRGTTFRIFLPLATISQAKKTPLNTAQAEAASIIQVKDVR